MQGHKNSVTQDRNRLLKMLALLDSQILAAEQMAGRPAHSVQLMAVSKTRSVEEIAAVLASGIQDFGENYLQEALPKIRALTNYNIRWHFIGAIQSNKTRLIAENFAWVHSLSEQKIAERLNGQRPTDLPPLNVCIEVNLGGEKRKAGLIITSPPSLSPELIQLATAIQKLPHLKLRGLMAIPTFTEDLQVQRAQFRVLHQVYDCLNQKGFKLDTLSMGMSNDFVAAIMEGSTIIRLGTAIFGPREDSIRL
jgi:pyridoxal phosphate enzyme (YggS family)